MPVTNYFSLNGQIIGEQTNGGSSIDYAVDALGSVTGTLVNGTLQNTYAYKPYGALLASTGAGTDPVFGWVGVQGYRGTGRPHSESYMRARHYAPQTCAWTSCDPSWPVQRPYAYCDSRPISKRDPTGEYTEGTEPPAYINNCASARGNPTIHACTECNVTTGTIWIIVNERTPQEKCIFPAILAHEHVHRDHLSTCCKQAGLEGLALAVTMGPEGYIIAKSNFDQVAARIRPTSECLARMAELRAIEALISICGVMDNPCCDYYYKRRTRLIKRLIPSDCHDVFNKPFPPCKGIFVKVRS